MTLIFPPHPDPLPPRGEGSGLENYSLPLLPLRGGRIKVGVIHRQARRLSYGCYGKILFLLGF